MMERILRVNGVRLYCRLEGSGPPLVLLHGWPQTSYEWRKVAPILAQHFTLIMPDLRGYGLSDKPPAGYDKKTMAADIRALVQALGYERILLMGHDRGARVAHRYALDYGETLEKMVLLDIIPTRHVFETADMEQARSSWHWYFHQAPDLPEALVGANPAAYVRYFLYRWTHRREAFSAEDEAEYIRAFTRPGAMRAGFEDYRAGATLDLEQDRADAGRKLSTPLLVLWGSESHSLAVRPVLQIWREYAEDVRGEALADCGHFLAEEQPALLCEKVLAFLR